MKHPLVGKAIFFYLAVWAVIMVIHTAVLYNLYMFSLTVSVVDAVVFNILTAGFGLSYWYVVQYIPAYKGVQRSLLTHLTGVSISVLLIVYGAFFILKITFPLEIIYQEFLWSSLLWRIIIGVFSLTLIILIYYLLRYNNNLQQKEQDELRLQHMLRHTELEMLKFQINPHFIFNSLNSISSLTLTDPEKAREMVIKLSDFLRGSLGGNQPGKHLLRAELQKMNLYLEIEKVRFGRRLITKCALDQGCEEMTLPNMILQPLYENAIKYGVYEQLEPVEINTSCTCEGGSLKISISNNYDSTAITRKGKGIGLKNVRNRLELIYGLSDLVTIEKNRTNFTVHLLIPQQANHDQSTNN